MTLSSGTRLGPYEVLAPLGAGGMGEVYRARDTRLSREVAIKVLPAELASDASRLRRFEKEARSASALNHPNIVTVYDIGSENGLSYIAMERVEGETLRKLIVGGALATRKLLPIAIQIADGLAKAHEAGIVHRDLKPENVMVTKDGLVKILDFGLAKPTHMGSGSGEGSHLPTETGTSPGMIVGTVGYMSPEQASGETVDFRSDQFSFGSILYELATGKRAFQKKTGAETLSAIINEEPPSIATVNPQAPAPLRWTVERCLAKDPDARYLSTRDLAHDLRAVSAHLSEASSPGAAGASRRPSRARRLAWVGVVIALSVGLGIAGRQGWSATSVAAPRIQQLTFRNAGIQTARFAPDGQTIAYTVSTSRHAWEDEILTTRIGSPESRSLGVPALLQSISRSSELAILLGRPTRHPGTLATVSLAGGAPREILDDVYSAGWAPDGASLAVIHGVGAKRRLEFPIGKVLYESSGRMSKVCVSPAGNRIAILVDGNLTFVDLSGKAQTVAPAFGFVWTRRGDEIWFNHVAGGATTFEAVTLSGRKRFLASFPGDFALQDISPDGSLLLERMSGESELIGQAAGQTAERNLSWLDDTYPVDLSADGKMLLFNERGEGGGARGAVYLRKTDGSSAVRLGEGGALALSPDGSWALCDVENKLVLLPTGPGSPRPLPVAGIELGGFGGFFPDGRRIVIRGSEPGHKSRLYAYDIESFEARPLTEEGVPEGDVMLSPDGRLLLNSRPDGKSDVYSVEGGPPRAVPGVSTELYPIKWCADSQSLFVRTSGDRPVKVYRLKLSTGSLELWKEFSVPFLRSGLALMAVFPTPDGKSYVYWYQRHASDLFLVQGLR